MNIDVSNFDANQVNPNEGFEAIPVGEYKVMMIGHKTEESDGKPGNYYVECTYRIVDGNYKGRLLFDKLFLQYQNPDAVKLARSRLSAVCHACGVMKIDAMVELYNAPMQVTVGIRKYNGKDYNEIKEFIERKSSLQKPASQAGETQQVEANPVEGGEDKPAWQK